jgi:hypothetical protein
MAGTTVCFIARMDFESKPGGDTIQWHMYDRAAREAGLRTTTWFDDSPIPEADMFHALNIDRPLELYPKLVRVKQLGIPFSAADRFSGKAALSQPSRTFCARH